MTVKLSPSQLAVGGLSPARGAPAHRQGGGQDSAVGAPMRRWAGGPSRTRHPRGPLPLSHWERIPRKNKHKNKYRRSVDSQ